MVLWLKLKCGTKQETSKRVKAAKVSTPVEEAATIVPVEGIFPSSPSLDEPDQ